MEVISKAIESQYLIKFNGSKTEDLVIEGLQYLEKIIQLPFQIPPVSQEDMADFVRGLLSDWAHEECPKVFAEALAGNPRQAKRAVNSFQLAWRLTAYRQEKLGNRITPIRLAKIFAIQAVHPDLYNLLLKEEPRYLRDLEEYCCYESARERGLDYEAITKGFSTRIEPPSALVPFLSRSGANAVRRILTLHEPGFQNANFVGLPVDELRLYFTLTRPTEISKSPPLSEIVRLGFEPQMIRIPAGEFLMGSRFEQPNQTPNNAENSDQAQNEYPQRLVELHEYFIGKYPVTNREYQTFVHDTKYQTPLGWEREQYPPDKGDHPVSNIRWHDANAYCRWLSEKTGKPYHLPTEAEWEKASRGQDGRVYPWGNIFDSNKCNSGELGVNETTPVGQFSPEGDSPYGCADMIGNVWEWCNDWFSEDEYKYRTEKSARNSQGSNKGKNRIIRGGSFIDNHEITRCAYRGVNQPDFSNAWIGFRVALSIGNTKIE